MEVVCGIIEENQTYLIAKRGEAMDIHVHAYRCRKIGGSLELHAHHEVRYVSYQELYDYTFEPSDYAILDGLGKHKASLATNKDFS